jgi:hypothetical protein
MRAARVTPATLYFPGAGKEADSRLSHLGGRLPLDLGRRRFLELDRKPEKRTRAFLRRQRGSREEGQDPREAHGSSIMGDG